MLVLSFKNTFQSLLDLSKHLLISSVIRTSAGDPSVERGGPLQISYQALQRLYDTLGFGRDYNPFYTTRLFHCSYHSHYDEDADPGDLPTSISKFGFHLVNT